VCAGALPATPIRNETPHIVQPSLYMGNRNSGQTSLHKGDREGRPYDRRRIPMTGLQYDVGATFTVAHLRRGGACWAMMYKIRHRCDRIGGVAGNAPTTAAAYP
jgi:hypothetical protein